MPSFRVDLRGARAPSGNVFRLVDFLEADDWFDARVRAHRRYGVDPHDPAMLVTEWTPEEAAREVTRILEEQPAASGAKRRRLTKAKRGKRIRA